MKFFRRKTPSTFQFTPWQRFIFWLLLTVGVGLIVAFGSWWFQPQHVPGNFRGILHALDFGLFGLLSYIIWHQIIMDLLLWSVSGKVFRLPPIAPQSGKRVAFITTFVPGKEPIEMLAETVRAMVAADYPHDTWVLDEGNDPSAAALCRRLGAKHFSRHQIARYNTLDGRFSAKTKGGNHNSWYHTFGHQYEFVAQIDTDFIPKRHFLTRTLGYFNDSRVAFVGTPQVYGNLSESLIAKGAAQQTYSFYGPILRGFSGHNTSLLIGANHVIRVAALADINFYRAHLTEDLLTGMTFHSRRWTSVYVPEILAVGEGPTSWEAYFNQQMRWAFGCIDILFHHSSKLLRRMKRPQAVHYFLLQQHYFNGLALAVANVLLALYFFFGINASAMNLLPLALIYGPLLLWQGLMASWLQRLNVDPKTERGLLLPGKFVSLAAWPVYFLAFVGVVRGKRISYQVTPKGVGETATSLKIFLPHILFGTLTVIDVVASIYTHHQAAIMIFWAALNTVSMYLVVGHGLLQNLRLIARRKLSRFRFSKAVQT